MSRRLNACRTCSGMTRHDDRRCSACRRGRVMPATVWLLPDLADPMAPTVAELNAGVRVPGVAGIRIPVLPDLDTLETR